MVGHKFGEFSPVDHPIGVFIIELMPCSEIWAKTRVSENIGF